MFKFSVVCVSLFVATVAHGQPMEKDKGGPMGRGGGGVSPVMMTCGDDLAQFCDGKRGMPGVQCLMENITDISEPCADALEEASANMRQGHGNNSDGNTSDSDNE